MSIIHVISAIYSMMAASNAQQLITATNANQIIFFCRIIFVTAADSSMDFANNVAIISTVKNAFRISIRLIKLHTLAELAVHPLMDVNNA
jgi:hypothetical protein